MKRRSFLGLANALGLRLGESPAAAQAGAAGAKDLAGPGPAGGFDWRRTSARRTVFTVDYWPGIPAIDKEGRPDMRSDLEHLKGYADPVTVRTLAFAYRPSPPADESEARGWLTVPDVLHASDAELRAWQSRARAKLEPLLEQYRAAGIQCLDLQTFFDISGHDGSPEWYRSVPDWEECDLSGRPLSAVNREWSMGCLSHPTLYEVVERTFWVLSFLRDEPAFLGFHLENEPHLGRSGDLRNFGGNPHTRRAFREYLGAQYRDVAEMNRVAGTRYEAFGEVEIADRNWLVQAMAGRFRSRLITGVYETRIAALAKRHFPSAVTMTRLETGRWLRESDGGREINGIDFTYLKDSAIDVVSWSHNWDGRDPDGFGQLNVTGGLLRGSGKMIGLTEPHVQRYGGGQWCVFRPDELLHFIYRGLYYNFRMFNLHSWDRTGAWAIYNEPFGAVYSKHRGTLAMVARLRSELERIAPFETFGAPLAPPLALVVSRSAAHFPGSGGNYYGNWLSRLTKVLEQPRFTCYDVAEEHTADLERVLGVSRGAVVMDACLEDRSRRLLADFAERGGRVLIIGAPAAVGPGYGAARFPEAYPVEEPRASLAEAAARPEEAVACRVPAEHPVLAGIEALHLLRPEAARPRASARAVAESGSGAAAVAGERMIWLAGFPAAAAEQEKLLENFARWCGVEPPGVVISRYEKATVVQNWDTANQRRDGALKSEAPWTGSVRVAGPHTGQVWELREDHPWLAYRVSGGEIVLESVKAAPNEAKVFRKESARELPHFENLPDSLGFSFWWAGESHPVIGRFTASEPVEVDARIAGGAWTETEIGWYVAEIGTRRAAEGTGRRVRFRAEPGREYYLTAVLPKHPNQDKCPLCLEHAFE